ncbi:MAG: hypothetical protein GX879_09150 [Bacteroidales bacterium]|nr:hypothetical protein [Bacteroidales bacterium]
MKINIQNKHISLEQIENWATDFEDVKTVSKIGKNKLKLKSNSYAACRVFLKKDKIYIARDFSTKANYRAFYLAILLLGILLPLAAFYIFWFPKIKRFSKSVFQNLKTRIEES